MGIYVTATILPQKKEKMDLKTIKKKEENIKEEIRSRMKCRIEDFEIEIFDSGTIAVFWDAFGIGIGYSDIPDNWIVTTIDWREKRASVFAEAKYFKCLKE